MNKFLKRITLLCACTALMLASSCSLDIANPNQPSELEVLSTREGIIALAVGVQQTFATAGMTSILTVTGLTSRELTSDINVVQYQELEDGGAPLPTNNILVVDYWTRMYKIIAQCDQIIANAPKALPSGGTQSGILALAYTYKAMCLGNLAQCFEQAALSSGTRSNPASFVPRAQVYAEALRLLGVASTQVASGDFSDFNAKVLVKGFHLPNTIALLRARYSLFAGANQDAITFANAVNITAAGRSEFRYDNGGNNNAFFAVYKVNAYFVPRRTFGFEPSTGLVDTTDARLSFFVTNRVKPSGLRALPCSDFTPNSFFGSLTASIPVFRSGEVALIRAEANARLGKLDDAITDINAVRTKKAADDYLGLGAGLPAYSGAKTADAVLLEIYRQRCAELYVSGFRMEDQRRFARPAPVPAGGAMTTANLLLIERTRNFYPYPQTERDNNPNTPPDPAL